MYSTGGQSNSRNNNKVRAGGAEINWRRVQANIEAATACPCDVKGSMPGWLLDVIAERKLTGGYNIKRANLCPTCNTYKSVNGSCLCT